LFLSEEGVKIVSPRIQTMLDIMCPIKTAPVVNAPPVIQDQAAPVAHTPPAVQALPVIQPPVVVQPLVVVQQAVVQDQEESSAMDCGPTVEDEDQILRRLFLKSFGYPLPELKEKSEFDDINMNLIDLTGDDYEEMEATVAAPVPVVVKTEPIEIVKNVADEINDNPNAPTIANVAAARKEQREFAKFAKASKIFVKTLPNPIPGPNKVRKVIRVASRVDTVIPEKEASDSADSNMSEARSKENKIVLNPADKQIVDLFEKDLLKIYAGPDDLAKKNVIDITKDVTDDANDASMNDAPKDN
jgi:hypothetical protein